MVWSPIVSLQNILCARANFKNLYNSTWIFVLLGDLYDFNDQKWDLTGPRIVRQQDFWYAMGMTVFIAIPWVTVRKVKVEIEIVS